MVYLVMNLTTDTTFCDDSVPKHAPECLRNGFIDQPKHVVGVEHNYYFL